MPPVQKYSNLQKEVKRKTKEKRRKNVDDLAKRAEDTMARISIKSVYNITRQLLGRTFSKSKPVKDKEGNIISQLDKQLDRWKEHFCELLNGEDIRNPPDIAEGEDLGIQVKLPKRRLLKQQRR